MSHENINFNENGTVSTNPKHPLIWQEHLSSGRKEDDQFVMLNIAMLVRIFHICLYNHIFDSNLINRHLHKLEMKEVFYFVL